MKCKYTILPVVLVLLFCNFCSAQKNNHTPKGRAYYISTIGNDAAAGTKDAPWQTIAKVNSAQLTGNDSILFAAGETFNGTLYLSNISGKPGKTFIIKSYGKGKAIINGGDSTAIALYKCNGVWLYNLHCKGSGRKTGNTKDGIAINTCSNIDIINVEVEGFQKAGLLVYASTFVNINGIMAHDNGFAGISVSGDYGYHNCSDISIVYCHAENNPGDPTNLTNHSGNGIIAGYCKNVLIDQCTATNNGWDMPRTGNGPVGIWCFEADSVIIQRCIAYKNKTSQGGGDGGGFDLDGGVTNSIIQYCLSYQNQGSGYGIFQYAGAGNWYNNIMRFNISENDGNVSPAHAGIFIWNSSRDTNQFKNCQFYNNIIYNSQNAAITYDKESEHTGFVFYNNIFVANDTLINGDGNDVFIGNNWYSLKSGFNMHGITNFTEWATKYHQEQLPGKLVGLNVKPAFKNPGNTTITSPSDLLAFDNYRFPPTDILFTNGLNLKAEFNISNGSTTLNGRYSAPNGMGACAGGKIRHY